MSFKKYIFSEIVNRLYCLSYRHILCVDKPNKTNIDLIKLQYIYSIYIFIDILIFLIIIIKNNEFNNYI